MMKNKRGIASILIILAGILAIVSIILYGGVMYKYQPVYFMLGGAIVLALLGLVISGKLPKLGGYFPICVAALLAIIAVAVAIFVSTGMRMSRYGDLEKEPFLLPEPVEESMRRQQADFNREFSRDIALGVGLCVASPIPAALADAMYDGGWLVQSGAALTLVMVAAGVYLFTRDGIVKGSFAQVLQEGDHALERKRRRYAVRSLGRKLSRIIDDKVDQAPDRMD